MKPFLPFIFSVTCFWANAQCIEGDCVNGKGTFVFISGTKYVGEFKDGEINGFGTCYYKDGTSYSGDWKRRYPDGKGIKTYPDGSSKSGIWERGILTEESVVEGKSSRGQLDDEDNEENVENIDEAQSGCITGNCKDGYGVFTYPDGSKYEGNFSNGRINGFGIWHFANGAQYEGFFKNALAHGKGIYADENGEKVSGKWYEGEFVEETQENLLQTGCVRGDCKNGKGTYIFPENGTKYIGSFLNNLPEGIGTAYFTNGEKYIGEWQNGAFEGKGTLTLSDGRQVIGYWQNGTYAGKEPPKPTFVAETEEDDEEPSTVTFIPENGGEMKVWSVIIGISSYSHMPPLKYSDDDAYRMLAFMKSPEGGALQDEQIRILIDEEATRQNIIQTMKDIFQKAGKNDLVMLYFSGHGLKGSFLPIDYDGNSNKLLHEEINAILEKSPAKYKLCIADACHSGSLLAAKGVSIENTLLNYYKTLAQAVAGTALIMSSKTEENSLESSGLRQGVFTHFLIRGLKGEADLDGDKVVTVQELYDFIEDNVRTYTNNRQSPVIQGDYDPKMTISVVRK